MICSKCGAECNDNQAFCLKCGNPMQLMADFNLIEKELASSIDEFMNEMESEETDIPEETDEMKTIDVPLDEINMGLKVMDINREKSSSLDIDDVFDQDMDDFEDLDEDITPVYVPKKNDKKQKNKKKSKKGLYIGISIAVVLVAIIALFVILFTGDSEDNKENISKDFAYYYENAETALNKNDADTALDNALSAVENAKNDADKIKARKLVKSVYEKQNYSGEYYIKNLEELYYLGESDDDTLSVLVAYYVEQGDTDALVGIYRAVDEETISILMGDRAVAKPEASAISGQYNNFINVELTAENGCSIYYILEDNGTKGAVTEYFGIIDILKPGKYVLSAYAVDENGIPSYEVSYNYEVIEGEAEGPVVLPAAGTYNKPTEITIQVPEGSKAYYTYDGSTPTKESTEYTEPVEMLRDVNTFKAILVDKYGNVSEVTSLQYNLNIERQETLASGKDKVWQYYYNNGIIDAEGNQADGSVISVTYYNAVNIGNDEYYIYQVIATSLDGTTTTGGTYCAVNTFDGTVYVGITEANGEFIIPEAETPEE